MNKWDRRFFDLAKTYSMWSKDPSRKIGAIAIDPTKKIIISHGYNGFPRGIADTDDRLRVREEKYKYVVHAEMNVIYNASYSGVSLNDSHIYVYGLPVCSECAKGIIQVGVKHVHILVPIENDIPTIWADHWIKTKEMFDETGVQYSINFEGLTVV